MTNRARMLLRIEDGVWIKYLSNHPRRRQILRRTLKEQRITKTRHACIAANYLHDALSLDQSKYIVELRGERGYRQMSKPPLLSFSSPNLLDE
jgi:hypothetical protein